MSYKSQRGDAQIASGAIRVTQVLDYFKEPWYTDWLCRVGKREANRVSKAAMKTGTSVDTLIKASPMELNEFLPEYKKASIESINCLTAYYKWLAIYKPNLVTPCTRLNAVIENQEVTGEPDIMVDDALVDIKCSSKISLKHWIQVNMYNYLLNPEKVIKVGILRLDKVTASYEYIVKNYDPSLVNVWCGMMVAYVAFNKGGDYGDVNV